MDFRSDNVHGASREILEAMTRAAAGTQTSYGGDDFTARVRDRCREIFECDLDVIPALTGTAANALAIASMVKPWGAVLCHSQSHIYRDEWNAPEFFTGGARLFPVQAAWPTMTTDEVVTALRDLEASGCMAAPSCVSITNATEGGTLYRPDNVRAIRDALPKSIRMHMDGARFSNALVALGCSPADLTWRAGVDVLTFGATKNGALSAELIIIFNDSSLADEVRHRARRAGQRLSKMRFLSAQFEAFFANDLWLRNARHANAMAAKLGAAVEPVWPVEANVVFVYLTGQQAGALRAAGFLFGDWNLFGEGTYRFVTSFATREADVDSLIGALNRI